MSNVTTSAKGLRDIKGWLVFLLLAFIWGGSFILIKKGLVNFMPVEVAALRIFISALAFLPLFFLLKLKIPSKRIGIVLLICLLGNGFPAFLFALAQTRLGSAVAGVLNSLTPIFALLISIISFRAPMKRNYIPGLALGSLGIAVLMAGENDWRVSAFVGFVVLGTLCYGTSVNLVKRYAQDIHPVALASVGFWALGFIGMLVLVYTGAFQRMTTSIEVWKVSMPALIILALVCTVLANVLFYWLIQRTSVVFSSAIAYAIPCMALVWGSFDGENITWIQLSGFAFIAAAIYTLRRNSS